MSLGYSQFLKLRSDIAAQRLLQSWVNLRLVLIKANFHPDQPRVPSGNPDGGQWGDSGGGYVPNHQPRSLYDGISQQIADNTPRNYSVDLRDHENYYGGHSISRHVGKSETELFERINTKQFMITFFGEKKVIIGAQVGTYLSLEDANHYTNEVLNKPENQYLLDLVKSGELPYVGLFARFGFKTGKEAYRPDKFAAPYIRPTYALYLQVERDPQNIEKLHIITSFPTNELPGEKKSCPYPMPFEILYFT